MINHLRNEVHKLLFRMNLDDCKKLLEVNKEREEEMKKCKNNIKKLTSSLEEIEKAHAKFYEDDRKENDDEIEEEKNIENENEENKEINEKSESEGEQ